MSEHINDRESKKEGLKKLIMMLHDGASVETVKEELPPLDQLPSLDALAPPDFESQFAAPEYDTEFILEEESEALDSVLKDLGWDEEH